MTERTLDILSICGSLRKASLHRMLQNTLPELAPKTIAIEAYPQLHDIPMYDHDVQDLGFPEPVTKLADRIREADGLIFVSPEYNWSVSGVLKNAIDWISRLQHQPFKEKPILLQSAAGGLLGGSRAQYHMRQIMSGLEAPVFSKPEVFVSFAPKKFDTAAGRLTDEESRTVITKQLEAFDAWVRKHHLRD